MDVIKKDEVKQECCLIKLYGVDHSKATEAQKTTFATIGTLFKGGTVCAYCLGRLSWIADTYGYSDQRDVKGAINAAGILTVREAIKRSPLRKVFEDINLTDLRWELDHNVFPLTPEPKAIKPNINDEIERLSNVRTVR